MEAARKHVSHCAYSWMIIDRYGAIEDESPCLSPALKATVLQTWRIHKHRLCDAHTATDDFDGTQRPLALQADGGPLIVMALRLNPGRFMLRLIRPFAEFLLDRALLELTFEISSAELDVLEQLTKGHSTERIALDLKRSPHTVKTHLRAIYGKLGVTNKVDATRIAIATRRECWYRQEMCNWQSTMASHAPNPDRPEGRR